jgi:hypothetical protein
LFTKFSIKFVVATVDDDVAGLLALLRVESNVLLSRHFLSVATSLADRGGKTCKQGGTRWGRRTARRAAHCDACADSRSSSRSSPPVSSINVATPSVKLHNCKDDAKKLQHATDLPSSLDNVTVKTEREHCCCALVEQRGVDLFLTTIVAKGKIRRETFSIAFVLIRVAAHCRSSNRRHSRHPQLCRTCRRLSLSWLISSASWCLLRRLAFSFCYRSSYCRRCHRCCYYYCCCCC